jgi:short-subunit dehydrogenase
MIAPFEFVQLPDAQALMETNFFGALNCIQAVLPSMLQRRTGTIVNIASIGGIRGVPNLSVYSATKAALIALSGSLRVEVKSAGLHVLVFATGRIRDTAIFDRAVTYGPVKLYQVLDELTPAAAAAALLDAVARRRRLTIIPRQARLLYIVDKFFPRLIDRLLLKKMPKLEKS